MDYGILSPTARIAAAAGNHHAGAPALLVAVSGIHASGKGRVAACLTAALLERGLRIALIGIDAWYNPASVRRRIPDPVESYYRTAVRWDDLFASVVEPLRRTRSLRAAVRLMETGRDRFYLHRYDFRSVDVILLEGIFLLKRELRDRYDLSWWVDCDMDEALQRAARRSRNGLDPEAVLDDFRRIYLPAQRIHLERDRPAAAATGVIAMTGGVAAATPLLRCGGMPN